MPEGTLTAIGDEAIEARIVAWVLGEASAFEAAELERLCTERPELAIFHRRMRALHDLTGEAVKSPTDESWKLSPAKCVALLDQIDPNTTLPEAFRETRVRRSAMRSILSIAACVLLAVVLFGLSAPMVMNQRKGADKIAAYSAAKQRELAAMEEEMIKEEQGMVALSPDLPKELIEATPRPMVLPERTTNAKPGARLRTIEPPTPETSAPADAMVMADMAEEKKVSTSMERKPSSPSSAMSKVIDSASVGAASIPMPEVAVNEPALNIGDGDDFGTGWGGSVDQLRSGKAITQGNRSGDGTVILKSIDGVLNNPRAGGLKNDLSQAQRSNQPEEGAGKSGAGNLALAAGEQPARTNPAFTQEHTRNEDDVRRNLYTADENYKLGKYDDAKRNYENVLRTDPYNSAARRGLEKLAAAKSDYYRAAYDHTRSELLTEVDKAWELDVPVDGKQQDTAWWVGNESQKATAGKVDPAQYPKWLGSWNTQSEGEKNFDGFMNYGSPIAAEDPRAQMLAEVNKAWELAVPADKAEGRESSIQDHEEKAIFNTNTNDAGSWSSLAQREMIRRQSTLAEADKLLTEARSSYAAGDYQKAYETYEKSLNLIPDVPGNPALQEKRNFLRKSLGDAAVALSMTAQKVGHQESAKQWRAKAREWDPSNPQASEETAMDASAELSAAEDPYSTFSLNISDASFQIAKAALAKGERPDPAGIKVEQFYNAVDYGDPAPRAGEPVACAIEQVAHPVIPGRNLVRVSLKTAAAGRSASQPLRLTLLVDQSGSMTRADRREAMHKALASLGTLLTEKDLVNVVGFSRTPRLLADGIKGDAVGTQLADMINQAASEGGTNLETAIDLASQLAQRRMLAGAQNRIVLFTDGAANLGNADPARLAEKVKNLRQQGIAFDIAGIAADDLNDNLLAELARNGNGRYSVVGKGDTVDFAKQLAGAFRPAAENVKVQVRFNPERVARYKLIGFERDRLKTEDFRNDAVDAAELAAEEAGVAIYQVEPIANGSGEIGEVSVRFRDTDRGEMVERMWTMAHNPSAPALDQAAPSMQLATLAMLAGEKLKGGPLADAIDLKQFATPQAIVKQVFGQDTRTAEMLRVIDALK